MFVGKWDLFIGICTSILGSVHWDLNEYIGICSLLDPFIWICILESVHWDLHIEICIYIILCMYI